MGDRDNEPSRKVLGVPEPCSRCGSKFWPGDGERRKKSKFCFTCRGLKVAEFEAVIKVRR